MAISKIVIQIPLMIEGESISFSINDNGSIQGYFVSWVNILDINEIGILKPINLFSIPTQESIGYTRPNYDAIEYAKIIDDRYDFVDNFIVSRIENTITIQSRIENLTFEDANSSNPPLSDNSNVQFTITNGAIIAPFDITKTDLVQDVTNSDIIKVEVTTTVVADTLTAPISITGNTANPLVFSYLRGQIILIAVQNSISGLIDSKKLMLPAKILESDISVNSIVSNSSSTTTVSITGHLDLVLQYSIDNMAFVSSNVFPDLGEGNFIIYVKDQFNHVVSKAFSVVDTNKKIPFFYISKSNPIRYAYKEDWDGIDIYKTDENTLSHEARDLKPYQDCQLFQTKDNPTTQIKTNYDTLKAFVISGESENEISVIKVRNYLSEKDSRDCVIYRISEGKTGLYFTSGYIYDFDLGTPIGNHEVNGGRLDWFRVGKIIDLEGVGNLEIKRSFYNKDRSAFVVELDYNYVGSPTIKKVKSIYDVLPFNLYEFNTNMTAYKDKQIRVKITAEDPDLETIELLSEQISVKDLHRNCILFDYFNDNNGDVFYETGIKHSIRVPYLEIKDNTTTNVEIHKGDTQVTQIDATLYEGDTIIFKPQSKEITKLVQIALLSDNLFANKQSFQAEDVSDKEKLDDTNFYELIVKLLKSEGGYDNNSIGESLDEITNSDVPGLVDSGSGFIHF